MGALEFDHWYREQHPRLVSSLVVVAGEVGLAAEAVDEACARAFERWDRVGAMASPGGWAYRTALNALRRRQWRSALEHRLLGRANGSTDIEAPPSWSAEVWDALRRLPRRERTAIALRYIADLTTEEIADAMGIAPGTVGSTLHSARRRLADVLAEPLDAAPNHDHEEATDG